MRVLLLAVFLAALPAAAQAQVDAPPAIDTVLTVEVAPSAGPIAPAGPFQALPIQVTYSYFEAAPSGDPGTITLAIASAPAWAVATVSPTTLFGPARLPPCGCQREVVLEAFLLASVTRDAPAFRAAPITVAASAAEDGLYKGSQATADAGVMSGYEAIVEATTPVAHHKFAAGDRWDAPVTVSNFANGASRVAFALAQDPPAGFGVTLPEPARIGARQQGEPNMAVFPVSFQAGDVFERGSVTLRVTATSAEDAAAPGDSTLVSFVLDLAEGPLDRGGAVARALPGPGIPALAGAVAVLAIALRRDAV